MLQKRQETLTRSQKIHWDMIIVGGGITGAGLFREASLAGHKALLIEKNDFASGTSWCSSKLIHGGIRYLEQSKISLMSESISEKKLLLQQAPQLVKPLPFLFPVYRSDRRWLSTIWLGTWVYALLAKLYSIPKRKSPQAIARGWPMLKQSELKGAMLYQDAQTLDTHLTLSSILAGQASHAQAFNHLKVEHIDTHTESNHDVVCVNELTGQPYTFTGKKIVLATGPWMQLSDPAKKQVVYSKGSHWVLQGNPLQLSSAVTMFSPQDGRVMFAIPWCDHTLVGTTDAPSEESPDHVRITPQENAYMQETLKHYFPNVDLQQINIMARYAGLRTLIGQKQNTDLSKLSREHAAKQTRPGIWEIYGGKLTTFRSMASDMLTEMGMKTSSKSTTTPWPTLIHADPQSLRVDQVEQLIQQEYACTVSDVLLYRTLSNLRLPDHGQQHYSMVCECLKQAFGYTDDQLAMQIQSYQEQSQQFDEAVS